MPTKPELINPYIKFAKSSKDVNLWRRINTRSFYDFGFVVFYIPAEIVDENKFYGEQKLYFSDYFETVAKMTTDTTTDEQIQYAKLGIDWSADQRIILELDNALFEKHVAEPLRMYSNNTNRDTGPKPGDLLYFYQHSNDSGESSEENFVDGHSIHYPWLFKILSVIFSGDDSSLYFAKDNSTKIIAEHYKHSEFNKIDEAIKEELPDFENTVPKTEENMKEKFDNLAVEEDDRIEIFSKRKGMEL